MTDSERKLDTPVDKIMLQLQAMADELEREKARARTYDALKQRASKGYVAGNMVYGYKNVKTNGHSERVVVEDEAAVVRRIFELAAAGLGKRRIAARLNHEGCPAPRARQPKARAKTWGPIAWRGGSVAKILARDLYRGRAVWNQRQTLQTREGKVLVRPVAEHIVVDVPHLRIVSEALWTAAHQRLADTRQTFLRSTGGRLLGKPATGVESKHLLTGMTVCSVCGGSLVAFSGGRVRQTRYGCHRAHAGRGCANQMRVAEHIADAAVLDMLLDDVLDPEVVRLTLDKLEMMFETAPVDVQATRARLTDALAQTERELARLASIVASDDASPLTMLTAMKERETKRAALAAQLRALDAEPTVDVVDLREVRRTATALLKEWRSLLRGNISVSRQLVTKLLGGGRVLFEPTRDEAGEFYMISLTPDLTSFVETAMGGKKAAIWRKVV